MKSPSFSLTILHARIVAYCLQFARHEDEKDGKIMGMQVLSRALLWSSAGAVCFITDVLTKAAPHDMVVNHYAHTPAVAFVLVSIFLYLLGVWHSRLFAVGAGMMFGGLCGNGGELLLRGYATDWIPVGGWLTNVADIAGLVGLLCCFTGYLFELRFDTQRVS